MRLLLMSSLTCLIFLACQTDTETLKSSEITTINDNAEAEIKAALQQQAKDWNAGSIDDFMKGYWKSSELTFIGSRGLTKGWKTTLSNYKKSYPDSEAMGELIFEVLQLTSITNESYYMVGRYTLLRKEDEPSGIFMLVWKKIDGAWKIIADQTCG